MARTGLAGIEVGRADGEVEVYQSRPFGCEVGSHFHQHHVSRSPPIMPDAEFLRSGLKSWYFVDEPSQFATELKRWYAYASSATGLLIASSLSLTTVWYTRFYQAEPASVVGTTKCPGSLCLTLVLPPSGRRVPSPARALPLSLSSYRPIRQSHLALLSFGYSPRSSSVCRLLPAPAASGIFPTLSLRIFPEMPEPILRR
jgi:hypothetical protein